MARLKKRHTPGTKPLSTTNDARYAICPGPDHSFEGVMHQLLGTRKVPRDAKKYKLTNGGFEASYELKQEEKHRGKGYGKKVMRAVPRARFS